MKIIILGSGLIGRTIAADLANDSNLDVTAADINQSALNLITHKKVDKKVADVSNENSVKELLRNYNLVINAVPGFMGYSVMKTIIDAGKNVIDIAFYPEDPFGLDTAAKEKNVTAIVDCGVSPGLSNLLIGYASSNLDEVSGAEIYVGGLPQDRSGYFEYKVVFSVTDVMEEYIRPARLIKNGKVTSEPALSGKEILSFPGTGDLEAFNSDGLRSLLKTVKCNNMFEKTLRYPGHTGKIETLIKSGLFDKEKITVKGTEVVPFEVTAAQLAKILSFNKGDKDLTILKVIVSGSKNKKSVKYEYNLFDKFDEKNNVHSMARTTGYTAAMAVRLLAEGKYDKKGIIPPEYIGADKYSYEFILSGLRDRGVNVVEKVN